MTSTSWFHRINTAAVDNSKRKVGSKNCDDSFPLVPAICIAISASALLGVLYFYRSQDDNRDHKGDDKLSRDVNFGIDNVGDWGRKKSSKTAGGSSDKNKNNDDDDDNASFDLPQHLQRELYKEERRKASVRFLAMKKPLYENIEMYAPDGETMLCTIGTKKANWYVRKKLAVWRDIPDCHKSIRLLFEPKNSKRKEDNGNEEEGNDEKLREYNCTHKLNICVSCGAKDASENESDEPAGLMRHYVVPYAYRKLFPTKFKTHLPHDVVLLCLDCHVEAEQAAKIQKTDVYEKLYRRDLSTRLAVVVDQDLKRIKSYARALWMHRDKLPEERIRQYETAIEEHLLVCDLEQLRGTSSEGSTSCFERNIPQEVLRELAENLQPERKNPKYIPLADLVVENLCQTDEDVSKFVVGWRKFFIDTLRPRHLPVGWSVDSPVKVDVNPVEEHDGDTAREKTKQEQ